MIREEKVFGKTIRCEIETDADRSVFEEVFVDRDYKVLDTAIQNASVIVDLGGHIGCFSVYAAILNANARIISYEPEKRNFQQFKQNIKLNKVRNVTVKNLAIGGERGERMLNLNEDSHAHSFVLEGEGKEKVSVTDFAGVLKNVGGNADLMKIDTEGAEFEFFDGASDEDVVKVGTFYIEYHEFGSGMVADKITRRLKALGFSIQKTPSFYDRRMGFILAKKA